MIDLRALSAPFPPEEIEWRIGSTNADKTSGLALAYITSRHVMDRLDSVVGPENWQDRYEVHGSRVICYLSIRINAEWVTKADGAGDTNVEAEKGGLSDALKRAAVKWGIGRYLYDLGNVWVECETRGRSTVIKKGQNAKLIEALNALKPINWATERDDLTRMVQSCQSLDDLAELWKTSRFQQFLHQAPQEFSSPVIQIKDRQKETIQQVDQAA